MFVFPGLLCRNGHPVNHKVLTLLGKLARQERSSIRDPPAIAKLFIHPCLHQIYKPVSTECLFLIDRFQKGDLC